MSCLTRRRAKTDTPIIQWNIPHESPYPGLSNDMRNNEEHFYSCVQRRLYGRNFRQKSKFWPSSENAFFAIAFLNSWVFYAMHSCGLVQWIVRYFRFIFVPFSKNNFAPCRNCSNLKTLDWFFRTWNNSVECDFYTTKKLMWCSILSFWLNFNTKHGIKTPSDQSWLFPHQDCEPPKRRRFCPVKFATSVVSATNWPA